MTVVIQRRKFVVALGGALMACPLAARAQTPGLPVIGYLGPEAPDRFASRLSAFHKGLGETGFIEGRNVTIEYRWADSHLDRMPALAAELGRRQVTVITA